MPKGSQLTEELALVETDELILITPDGSRRVNAGEVSSLKAIGEGQTVQDVTVSRSLGVSYTNSTGKSIVVKVIVTTDTSGNLHVSNGGIASYTTLTQGTWRECSFIVKNGDTYSVSVDAGIASVQKWIETRA
ncbi:hypothetical protein CYQ88_10820 [Hydrogenovibrio sp. SC-1]|uniref:hypothetical protein n=1 Tax=Hydrogenovibrio sp. SC-1 TaxID=2065820 RepID=UPI000C79CE88|nr:hypothetical protein [Hydrogenovibrio sp. SC-1]PLA73507.1 hypothetical protein CYQ88_10820 [Hydrogenovibrio sp. SC-1]